MSIHKIVRDRVHKRAFEHFYNTMEAVQAKPVQGMFNFRCFENACDYARKVPKAKVVMGMMFDHKQNPILHFWNTLDGEHLETTLGYQADYNSYYPIREISPNDYRIINDVFSDATDYYDNMFIKWYERPFIDRSC